MQYNDSVSTFLQYEEHKINAIKHLAMQSGSFKPNLALKAKYVQFVEQEEEEEYEENDLGRRYFI